MLQSFTAPDTVTRTSLMKTILPGNAREVWVPKGKLLAGPIATLLKQDTCLVSSSYVCLLEQDTSIFPLGTIKHITRKF